MSERTLISLSEVSVERLKGVGPKKLKALGDVGITNVFELLTNYPRRHLDRTRRVDVADLAVGDEAAVFAQVTRVRGRRTRQGRSLVEVSVSDEGGTLSVAFFNQPWRERQLSEGTWALFYGRVKEYRGKRQMANPIVDVAVGVDESRDGARVGRVVALYPASARAGITSWEIGGLVEESFRRAGTLSDPVPPEEIGALELWARDRALRAIHLPEDKDEVEPARRRLAFDEFLRIQMLLGLGRRQARRHSRGIEHPFEPRDLEGASTSTLARFLAAHPFSLTGAQRRVLGEIGRDMASREPMHRLLQGDVGAGKTLVATAALAICVGGGRQGALMAPTEVLAEQHLASLRRDLAELRVRDERVLGSERGLVVEGLSGRTRAPERRRILAGLAEGSVDVVVGTHALLSDDVRFLGLGLVVIDEQHRFGVEQRALLAEKGRAHSGEARDPDVLVMTATPIPRTAALVFFGDLERSDLDEMPSGRVPVVTSWSQDEEVAWDLVRDQVAAGHQAFVVCPLIEDSDSVVAAGALAEHERLSSGALRDLRVGLLHGQMPAAERDAVMERFRAGGLDVIVATVIIEVGVDVPNATVIVVEDAWRFGLAQLHQLRGRVGRGSAAGSCVLLGPAPSPEARQRLEALVATNDGFELARVDLDQRGEGTLYGARQKGRSDLRLASLRRDEDLLEAAHSAAGRLLERLEDLEELREELRGFVSLEEADYLFKS